MGEDAPTGSRRPGTRRTERLQSLSDGVFAFAMTLLVLDIAIPATQQSANHLLNALLHQWPGYLGYLISFSTIGAIWLGHNAVTDYLDRADVTLLRLNLLLLLFVALLPFPTHLLSSYVGIDRAERVAVSVYGLTLLVTRRTAVTALAIRVECWTHPARQHGRGGHPPHPSTDTWPGRICSSHTGRTVFPG